MKDGLLLKLSILQLLSTFLADEANFCGRISFQPDLCPSIGSRARCGADVYKYLVSNHLATQYHPVLDCTCVGEVAQRYSKECTRATTYTEEDSQAVTQPEATNDQLTSQSVDFLFLIELNCEPDVVHSTELLSAIRALLAQTNNRQIYHNIFTQVGFLVYSNVDGLQFIYGSDFSSEFPSDMLSFLRNSVSGNVCTSSTASVESGVRVLSRMTALVEREKKFKHRVKLSSNKTVVFWHRPYSDLHIVSILASKTSTHTGSSHRQELTWRVDVLVDKLPSMVHNSVSLHMAFDQTNLDAVSSLGDPSVAHSYSDCSHFRKAITLKALISADLGESLQALLISKGVEFRVHWLDDFKNATCILNTSPLLNGITGLTPSLPNKCLLGYSVATGNTGDWYCSPLHGINQKKRTEESSGSNFEDLVPLPAKYGLDHADLASTAQIHDTSLGQIELSINTLSSHEADNNGFNTTGSPPTVLWDSDKPFVETMVAGKVPVVLKGTIVSKWKALKTWTMKYLSQNMDTDILQSVKCTNDYLTFDPDKRSPLKLNISLPYTIANMSTTEFFKCVVNPDKCADGLRGHYYFGSVPDSLKSDVSPNKLLYRTQKDLKASKQFVWISSAGMITHGHFDQDYNFFVQLVGEKRFTLWSPKQHELMYVYPRIHPLWHKSRINFRSVDVRRFPGFSRAQALQVKLGPGDMLYVPPYTWHYVETLSPSVSLSTWSHDYDLYDHMNAVYKHDHKFDLLKSKKGQMFVLRLYLDMMIHDLYGFNETTQFFARLLLGRFSDLEHHFPPSEDDPAICASSSELGKIPTCVHVHGYAKLDMDVIAGHFRSLDVTVRDILFADYVEEITAQVVGVKKMLAFFRYCFQGQGYYVTDIDSEEHSLWDHSDAAPSD